jgi:hypothetical protein
MSASSTEYAVYVYTDRHQVRWVGVASGAPHLMRFPDGAQAYEPTTDWTAVRRLVESLKDQGCREAYGGMEHL